MRIWAALTAVALCAAPGRAADDPDFFHHAAREIAKVAPRAHVKWVAVRSLTAADGGGSGAIGEGAAERLVAALVHQGAPAVLHASVKSSDLPDAFVSGSYLPLSPDRVQITVTMISAVSGRPLYSEWRVVRNEWGQDGPRLGVGARRREAAPETAAAPAATDEETGGSCRGWEGRADALQRAVLLPKARYWAQRYWGLQAERALAADPARLITSKALEAEFQRSLRFWLAQREVPKLTPAEVRAMVDADLRTETLLDRCADNRGAVARR